MIINEDGEIITKKNEFNNRHKWEKTSSKEWTCIKCNCTKIQTGEKEYWYYINKLPAESKAPACDNSKLTIIKTPKQNDKQKEATQLSWC